MNRAPSILRFLVGFCLLFALLPSRPTFASEGGEPTTTRRAGGGEPQNATPDDAISIAVGGATLTGPFSLPQKRGGRLFLPLVSIARALGDEARVDAVARVVEVRRQTGVLADFNASFNQVRENGSPVLVSSNTGDIDFPPQPEALMLPVEIVAALLDVSIHMDETTRTVRVMRGQALAGSLSAARRQGFFEIYQTEYDYNSDRYPTGFSQNLVLRTTGRLFDGRFSLLGNLGGATGHGVASFRSGTFSFERANGQRFFAGDIGTGTDLALMSSTLRGAWAQIPIGSTRITAFAGRSIGGQLPLSTTLQTPLPGASPTPETVTSHLLRQTYDTNIAGAYLSFGTSADNPRRDGLLQFSVGGMSFDGPARRGRMLTGSVRSSSARYAVQADIGVGTFAGSHNDEVAVKGTGVAAEVAGTFNLRDDLSVQGRYSYSGRNFLTSQAGAVAPLNLRSLGATWKPRRWLVASLTSTSSARPGLDASRERFNTATINLAPGRFVSNVFLSHTQFKTTAVAGGSYTLLNATKDFKRWHLFVNASRVSNFGGTYRSAQLGASRSLRETDSLQLSQTFGSNGALGGAADWWTQSFLTERVSIGAGLGYSRSDTSSLKLYERLNASVRLPFNQTLQVSYSHQQSGAQLHLSLRGSLFSRRESLAAAGAPVESINSYGSVSGRVYQDLNFNGRYDAGVDVAQAKVRVRVDGNLSVETDENGVYHIANARAGTHAVALDLLSVRADLTILGYQSQTIDLKPGFDSVVDFRTIRTGRIKGIVWLDLNRDGVRQDDEQPLRDVRIVTASGRDTLTDEQGEFVIADLAPGQHVVLVDIKTLPDDINVRAHLATAAAPDAPQRGDAPESADSNRQPDTAGSLQVNVAAGAETASINFAVSPKPPEIKRF